MKAQYLLVFEIDEEFDVETCPGCWNLLLNSTPLTKSEKPVNVLRIERNMGDTHHCPELLIEENGENQHEKSI